MPESGISNRTGVDEQIICVFEMFPVTRAGGSLSWTSRLITYPPVFTRTHVYTFKWRVAIRVTCTPVLKKVRTMKYVQKKDSLGECSVMDNLVGCFKDLHRFSDLSAISRHGSRR